MYGCIYRFKHVDNVITFISVALCKHVYMTLYYFQLTTELTGLPDYKSRLETTVGHLLTAGHRSDREDLTAAADSFFDKLMMADSYCTTDMLDAMTAVLLVKAESGHPQVNKLGADYGLSQVCMYLYLHSNILYFLLTFKINIG